MESIRKGQEGERSCLGNVDSETPYGKMAKWRIESSKVSFILSFILYEKLCYSANYVISFIRYLCRTYSR